MPVSTPRGPTTPKDIQAQRVLSLLHKDIIHDGAPKAPDPSRRPLPSPTNGPPQRRPSFAPQAPSPRARDVMPSPKPSATPKQAPSRPLQKRPSGIPTAEEAPRSGRPYSPRDAPPSAMARQGSRGPSRLVSGGDGGAPLNPTGSYQEGSRRRSVENLGMDVPVARSFQDNVRTPRTGAEYGNLPPAARVPSPRVPVRSEQEYGYGYGQQYSSQQQYAENTRSQQPAYNHCNSMANMPSHGNARGGGYSDSVGSGDWSTGLPARASTEPMRGQGGEYAAKSGAGAGSNGWKKTAMVARAFTAGAGPGQRQEMAPRQQPPQEYQEQRYQHQQYRQQQEQQQQQRYRAQPYQQEFDAEDGEDDGDDVVGEQDMYGGSVQNNSRSGYGSSQPAALQGGAPARGWNRTAVAAVRTAAVASAFSRGRTAGSEGGGGQAPPAQQRVAVYVEDDDDEETGEGGIEDVVGEEEEEEEGYHDSGERRHSGPQGDSYGGWKKAAVAMQAFATVSGGRTGVPQHMQQQQRQQQQRQQQSQACEAFDGPGAGGNITPSAWTSAQAASAPAMPLASGLGNVQGWKKTASAMKAFAAVSGGRQGGSATDVRQQQQQQQQAGSELYRRAIINELTDMELQSPVDDEATPGSSRASWRSLDAVVYSGPLPQSQDDYGRSLTEHGHPAGGDPTALNRSSTERGGRINTSAERVINSLSAQASPQGGAPNASGNPMRAGGKWGAIPMHMLAAQSRGLNKSGSNSSSVTSGGASSRGVWSRDSSTDSGQCLAGAPSPLMQAGSQGWTAPPQDYLEGYAREVAGVGGRGGGGGGWGRVQKEYRRPTGGPISPTGMMSVVRAAAAQEKGGRVQAGVGMTRKLSADQLDQVEHRKGCNMQSSPSGRVGILSPHSDSGAAPRQLGRSLCDDEDDEGEEEEERVRAKPVSPPKQRLVRALSSSSSEEEESPRDSPSPPGGKPSTPPNKKGGRVTRHYGGPPAQKAGGGKLERALSGDLSEEEAPKSGMGKSGAKPKAEKMGATDGRQKLPGGPSGGKGGEAGAKKGSVALGVKKPAAVKAGAGKATSGTRRPVNAAC